MATETAGYIKESLPPYHASTYPAQRLFLSVKEKISPAEKPSLEQFFNAIKECDEKKPDDIRNHILERLKEVDAHDTLKDLTENIYQISSYFEKISVELGKLDEKNYRKKSEGSSEGEPIEKFRPTWKQIHAEFNGLVWKSRNIATEAAGHARDFRKVYVPILKDNSGPENGGPSIEDKKDVLKEFIQVLDKSKEASEMMCDSFLKLPPRIRELQARVTDNLKAVGIHMDKKLIEIQIELKKLEEKVTFYRNTVKVALCTALGGYDAMLLFPLIAALNPYTQYAIWGSATVAIGGITGAFITESKALEAEEECSNKITELDGLTGDEESFKQIQGKVELTLKNCDELCNLINAIGSIWAVLRTECQKIYDSMVKAENTKIRVTFNRMVGDDVLLGPYKKLEEILTLYANKVTSLSDCRKS